MTFGESMWLLLGAAIGAIAGCAIPYAAGLLAQLFRKPAPTEVLAGPLPSNVTRIPARLNAAE
jgi:hypothetical protein